MCGTELPEPFSTPSFSNFSSIIFCFIAFHAPYDNQIELQ